jgi:hypothetical protein
MMWHMVAPALAGCFTVICPDPRGLSRRRDHRSCP